MPSGKQYAGCGVLDEEPRAELLFHSLWREAAFQEGDSYPLETLSMDFGESADTNEIQTNNV